MFRHICFARELTRAGYDVRVFCASTVHNTEIAIDLGGAAFREIDYDGIRFVHLRTRSYRTNGLRRMVELWRFPRTLGSVAGQFEPPAAVIHSAFVPFDLSMARVVRKLGARHIVEIADLWPASFVAYGLARAGNPLIRLAYNAEHWLYHVADELVFTMEGGRDYIRERGWDTSRVWPVSLEKVHNINQGVDLAAFDADRARRYPDDDLSDAEAFKVVYVGSIRRANNLGVILDAAEQLQQQRDRTFRFLIYGDGDQRPLLEQACRDRRITNVAFKGRVAPSDVPSVLTRSDLNLFHFGETPLAKYGLSPNKLFIYFASGKPVLSTLRPGYDLVERYGAGLSVDGTASGIAEGVRKIAGATPEAYAAYCSGARKAAVDYDYARLAGRMIELLPPTSGPARS